MTTQESFKHKIRQRMAKTGERYAAARQVLIQQAVRPGGRVWVSPPEMSDDAIRDATGRGWDEWCDIIDGWPEHTQGHTAIAARVLAEHDITGWWAQAVTVSYERITGLRRPHQMADGTFTAGRSRTVGCDAELLRQMLLDPDARLDLFPGHETELRSRPTTKALRVAIGPGVALFDIQPQKSGKVKVTVAHERLPDSDALEAWKFYWGEWLDALE